MNLLERHARERTHSLRAGDVRLVHWWQAHTDSVRDMIVVREEPFAHQQLAVAAEAAAAEGDFGAASASSTARTAQQQPLLFPSSARAPKLHPLSQALLSCSFDRKICLWDRRGNVLGHLQQGRTEEHTQLFDSATGSGTTGSAQTTVAVGAKQPEWLVPWRFHCDVRGRYERAQGTARRVLASLERHARTGSAGQLTAFIREEAKESKKEQEDFFLHSKHRSDVVGLSDSEEDREEESDAFGVVGNSNTFLTQPPPSSVTATGTAARVKPHTPLAPSAPPAAARPNGHAHHSVRFNGAIAPDSDSPSVHSSSLHKAAPPLHQEQRDLLPARIREAGRSGVLSARRTQ
jgi:hypothetical protein